MFIGHFAAGLAGRRLTPTVSLAVWFLAVQLLDVLWPFFVLAGITLAVSFRSLLILFLGIEIISIPLYILTGSDKRNLKSNEASLKYFLLGAFSTGLMLMGITEFIPDDGGRFIFMPRWRWR